MHGDQHANMSGWLWFYAKHTPGCRVCADATWVMNSDAVPQPDIALRILPEYGGNTRSIGKYAGGAPELIVEVSDSSSSRDLGVKLELYQRSGVKEYLTILLKPKRVIWRQLTRGRYKEIQPQEDGVICSRVFPGLWLEPSEVWNLDLPGMPPLALGVKSPEHAAFVRKLAEKHKKQVMVGAAGLEPATSCV